MYGYKAKNGGSSETAYDFKTLLGAKRAVPEGYIAEIFSYEKEVPQKIKAIGEIPMDAEFICKYQKNR